MTRLLISSTHPYVSQVLESEKLKNTVNKMLTSYQKKISNLKKEKQILEDNFALVYEAHSKSKKNKLSEKLK